MAYHGTVSVRSGHMTLPLTPDPTPTGDGRTALFSALVYIPSDTPELPRTQVARTARRAMELLAEMLDDAPAHALGIIMRTPTYEAVREPEVIVAASREDIQEWAEAQPSAGVLELRPGGEASDRPD